MSEADSTSYLVGKRFPNRLFVGGLPALVSAPELAAFFSHFGAVIDSKIITDDEGTSKGYGFVSFKSTKDVQKVCQMGTLFLRNKKLNIGPAVKKEGPSITPEVVIVPSAPSKGEYFYPAINYVPQQTVPSMPSAYQEPVMYYYTVPETFSYQPQQINGIGYHYMPMEVPYNSINNNLYEPQNNMVRRGHYARKQRKSNNLPPRLQTKRSN